MMYMVIVITKDTIISIIITLKKPNNVGDLLKCFLSLSFMLCHLIHLLSFLLVEVVLVVVVVCLIYSGNPHQY